MACSTIDEYIAQFSEETRTVLQKIRETISAVVPEATERVSYQMPAFWQGEVLIWFSAMKTHIGIYPTGSGIAAFAQQLAGYKTTKGAIQIPYGLPVPYDLIAALAQFRLRETQEKRK